jgi:uncharacterized membrane protein
LLRSKAMTTRSPIAAPEVATAALLGALSGMRSMLGPAVVSHALGAEHRKLLQKTTTVLAVAELFADKLTFIPARTGWFPFLGRMANAGLSAYFATRGDARARYAAAAVGALSAGVSTRLSYEARHFASSRLGVPNTVAGVVEDLGALALARLASRRLKAR